jgi:hypothetical protein
MRQIVSYPGIGLLVVSLSHNTKPEVNRQICP